MWSLSPTSWFQVSTQWEWFSICRTWEANNLIWPSSTVRCLQQRQAVAKELPNRDLKSEGGLRSSPVKWITPTFSIKLALSNFHITADLLHKETKIYQRIRTRSMSTKFLVMAVPMKLFWIKRIPSLTPRSSTISYRDWMKAQANKLIRKMCHFRGVDNTPARKRLSAHAENSTRSNLYSRASRWLDLEQHPSSWTLCLAKTKIRSRVVHYLPSIKFTKISWIRSRCLKMPRRSNVKVRSCCRTVWAGSKWPVRNHLVRDPTLVSRYSRTSLTRCSKEFKGSTITSRTTLAVLRASW